MTEVIASLLVLSGAALTLLAALGVVRMPDLFTRLQVTAKASTLGVGFVMLAVSLHFNNWGTLVRALAILFFVFLTAPIAAHVIARAAYFLGMDVWGRTINDEGKQANHIRGRYDPNTHELGH